MEKEKFILIYKDDFDEIAESVGGLKGLLNGNYLSVRFEDFIKSHTQSLKQDLIKKIEEKFKVLEYHKECEAGKCEICDICIQKIVINKRTQEILNIIKEI